MKHAWTAGEARQRGRRDGLWGRLLHCHCGRAARECYKRFQCPALSRHHGRVFVSAAEGKSAGIFWVTLPVAAHSAPRCRVTMKPTHFI